jgi:hypothetical protein
MMHLAFLALATSVASAGWAIVKQIRTWPGYIGLGLLGISALGLLLAAMFTTDPITASDASRTFSGNMPVLGASLDWTPVAALLLSFSLARNRTWHPIRKRLFITAGITMVAMIGFILTLPHDGTFGPGVLSGLSGRVLIVSYLGWPHRQLSTR